MLDFDSVEVGTPSSFNETLPVSEVLDPSGPSSDDPPRTHGCVSKDMLGRRDACRVTSVVGKLWHPEGLPLESPCACVAQIPSVREPACELSRITRKGMLAVGSMDKKLMICTGRVT